MTRKSQRNTRRSVSAETFLTIANSPVLDCESADDFEKVRRALECEINPQGFIEEMYVSDIAVLLWEILRLRRGKNEVLNRKYWEKLDNIFERQCTEYGDPDPGFPRIDDIDYEKLDRLRDLAKGWFTDEKAREKFRSCWADSKLTTS